MRSDDGVLKIANVTRSGTYTLADGTPALMLEIEQFGTIYIPMDMERVNLLKDELDRLATMFATAGNA